MITIEQLLESVDLDFEPRWVTKDLGKHIEFWSEKPKQGATSWRFNTEGTILCSFDGRLKLAEFENKHWTECIYEVPRKTTGKIEKLKIHETSSGGNDMVLHIQKTPATPYEMHHKINELVDAVNEHADIIRQIGQWGSSKGECLWCEKITKFEPKEI
jgi:hypothetical protein